MHAGADMKWLRLCFCFCDLWAQPLSYGSYIVEVYTQKPMNSIETWKYSSVYSSDPIALKSFVSATRGYLSEYHRKLGFFSPLRLQRYGTLISSIAVTIGSEYPCSLLDLGGVALGWFFLCYSVFC